MSHANTGVYLAWGQGGGAAMCCMHGMDGTDHRADTAAPSTDQPVRSLGSAELSMDVV
jgi:hypothetical protein